MIISICDNYGTHHLNLEKICRFTNPKKDINGKYNIEILLINTMFHLTYNNILEAEFCINFILDCFKNYDFIENDKYIDIPIKEKIQVGYTLPILAR